MKPYKNPTKYLWICPVCREKLYSGGLGHIEAKACGHMRNKHPDECLEKNGKAYNMRQFIKPGLKLGKEFRESLLSMKKEIENASQ